MRPLCILLLFPALSCTSSSFKIAISHSLPNDWEKHTSLPALHYWCAGEGEGEVRRSPHHGIILGSRSEVLPSTLS